MQGAEDEAEGSVLTYVTEAEFRKQRSRSPSCSCLKEASSPFKPFRALSSFSLHLLTLAPS